jgi:hypothetical protein
MGNQRFFQMDNPLELIEGTDYYSNKKKLFNHVVGFAKFSEYLIVAEVRKLFGRAGIPAHQISYPVHATETSTGCPDFLGWSALCHWFIPANDAT